MKSGFLTSEFFMMMARFFAGVYLVRDPATRDIGTVLLGISTAEARDYMKNRVRLKLKGGGAVPSSISGSGKSDERTP